MKLAWFGLILNVLAVLINLYVGVHNVTHARVGLGLFEFFCVALNTFGVLLMIAIIRDKN